MRRGESETENFSRTSQDRIGRPMPCGKEQLSKSVPFKSLDDFVDCEIGIP